MFEAGLASWQTVAIDQVFSAKSGEPFMYDNCLLNMKILFSESENGQRILVMNMHQEEAPSRMSVWVKNAMNRKPGKYKGNRNKK